MGGTRWSDDEYQSRAKRRRVTGQDAFEHDDNIRAGRIESGVHQKMNPLNVKVRESRDSDAHPESHAVAVLFDVTGSMQSVPRVLQQNLPRLMNLLIEKGYLAHPQIMIGAIGDATCDTSPLQVGQFESGIEIEDDLGKIHMEGGGGGHITESYELAMYFMAYHTSLDCYEKRDKKGYLFIIGDEAPYPTVKKAEVKQIIGDKLQADVPVDEMLEALKRRYEAYYVIPKMTSNWGNKEIAKRWTKLLGQNVLRLEEPAGICELIASVIGVTEGKVGLDEVEADLEGTGAKPIVVRAVTDALIPVAEALE